IPKGRFGGQVPVSPCLARSLLATSERESSVRRAGSRPSQASRNVVGEGAERRTEHARSEILERVDAEIRLESDRKTPGQNATREPQRQLTDLGVQRLDVHRRSGSLPARCTLEHFGCKLDKLVLPIRDLIRVNVELLRWLSECTTPLDGCECHFSLEDR